MNELLDAKKIESFIEPAFFSRLKKIEIFDSIDSTNSYLMQQAKKGAVSGTICLAETQTAGRGRQGKQWISPHAQNVYCSLLWNFPHAQKNLSSLSLAVAVIVARALKKYGVAAGIQLKWPNDILFSSRKLAGILLENVTRDHHHAVVIGIGVNLFFPEKDSSWIDLHEMIGQPVQRNHFIGILLNQLLSDLPAFEMSDLLSFIDEWRACDFLYQKKINVQMPMENFSGIALGIREDGALIFENQQGEKIFLEYGEVSVTPTTTLHIPK